MAAAKHSAQLGSFQTIMSFVRSGNIFCSIVQCPNFVTNKDHDSQFARMYGSITSSLSSSRLVSFYGGRVALHESLFQCSPHNQNSAFLILKNKHGGPILPSGYIGSISHKNEFAVGIAAATAEGEVRHLGVDIEKSTRERYQGIAKRVLTANETASLGDDTGLSMDEEVLLRFSLKESVFKALHPLVQRHVPFCEVEVYPRSDLSALVCPLFPPPSCSTASRVPSVDVKEGSVNIWGEFAISARWEKLLLGGRDSSSGEENYWLTIVDVRKVV